MADSQYNEDIYPFNLFSSALLFPYSTGCQFTSLTAEEPVLEKIEKAFSVNAGGSLTIVSEFGAIDIQTAEQNEVAVVVTKESKSKLVKASQEVLEDFKLVFEHEGSDVRIEGIFKHGREHWQKQLNRLKIHFLVTVPRQYSVDLDTSSGGISVAALDSDVRAKTSGGSLRLGDITGTVWGQTSGGSIELTSCGGQAELKTSGGSIEVVNVAGDVQARTSGGNLRFGAVQGSIWGKTSGGSIKVAKCSGGADVQTSGGNIILQNVGGSVNAKISGGKIHAFMITQPDSDCSLHTSGGGITVVLTPDITIDVEAETKGGHVSTDFVVESVIQGKVPKNRLKGSINGGGPLLKLRTSGGNIHLQKSPD